MRFYTTDQLGPNRFLTPEGFLVCKDVPIGRTGDMLYAAGEVPIEAGPDGIIRITRDAESVFHDDTISSFEGKPITMDHPTTDVTPLNWGQLAKGVVQHVRRGSGSSENLLLANLLITDHAAIKAVRDGLRQVSSGYDAEYEQVAPGTGRQRNIIGNHVALVERGRCGERCAIGDKDTMTGTAAKKTSWKDRLRNAFKSRDEGELEAVLSGEDAPAEPLAVTTGEANTEGDASGSTSGETSLEAKVDALIARIEALEARGSTAATVDAPRKDDEDEDDDEKDDEDEDDDEEAKRRKRETSKDKKGSRDAAPVFPKEVQDVFSRAEILAPGIKLPTHDAAMTPAKVRDSLCALRRKALTRFYETEGNRPAVLPFTGGNEPNFQAMTCDAVATVFVGASEIKKRENNMRATVGDANASAQTRANVLHEINERNRDFWKQRGGLL